MAYLPTELFLSDAYLQVLGRPADPAGYLTYLKALRLGLPRQKLMEKLQNSGEGLARRDLSTMRTPTLSIAADLWPAERSNFVERLLGWRKQSEQSSAELGGTSATHGKTLVNQGERQPKIDRTSAGTAAFTIATRSYLPFVRVLMQSLRTVHPEFHLFLLLVDDLPEPVIGQGWTTVQACDLGIEGFDDMSLRYDVVEFCTALKPFFMRWLLDHTRLQSVIYLDPDVQLFAPMHQLMQALEAGVPVVLTPHITAPLSQAGEPSEHTLLKSGVFNLGFAAVQRSNQAHGFLDWWSHHLRTDALIDLENNLFTDQRWCDMAPALVPGLLVMRDPAYNVAYWNLPQRTVTNDSTGRWLVDDRPMVFFHFSGFNPIAPETISKYQTRLEWHAVGNVHRLFLDYAKMLLASGWSLVSKEHYAYDQVEGVQLSRTLRSLYRALHPQPSGLSRKKALHQLLHQCVEVQGNGEKRHPPLTPLMRFVHASRSDLIRCFDLTTTTGRFSFAGWYWSTGVVEHGLVGLHRSARDLAAHGGV